MNEVVLQAFAYNPWRVSKFNLPGKTPRRP